MNNPFNRALNTRQWLLSSICWTGSCLGAVWLADAMLIKASNWLPSGVFPALLLASLWGAHGLIWWRGVVGGRTIIRYDERHNDLSWTRLGANLWLIALLLFQMVCLLWLLFLAVTLLPI